MNGYEKFLQGVKRVVSRTPMVGPAARDALHGFKKASRTWCRHRHAFEDV